MLSKSGLNRDETARRGGAAFSDVIVRGFQGLLDYLALFAAGVGCWFVVLGDKDETSLSRYVFASLLAAAVSVGVLGYSRMYDFDVVAHPQSHLRSLVGSIAASFLGLLLLSFSLGHADAAYSRMWAYAFFAAAVLLILIERLISARLIQRLALKGHVCRNVVVIGAGEHGVLLVRSLMGPQNPWLRLIGIFDDRHHRRAQQIEGYTVGGGVEDLVALAKTTRIDDVFVALPWGAEARLFEIFDRLQAIPANIHLSPEIVSGRIERARFVPYFGITALCMVRKPIEGWSYILKSIEDKLIALLALILLSPVLAAVTIAIKIESKGPILFRQIRYGFNNKLIEVYKFRSMYHEARDAHAEVQTTKTDPRVTKVGRFIRRTSIDELPQLLNVLKGNMSIVGPRPHAIRTKAGGRLFEEVVSEYAVRHKIKPGITGWAQVNGWRGETDTEEKLVRRVQHDIYYMENWSIAFDIEIIIRTAATILSSQEAY